MFHLQVAMKLAPDRKKFMEVIQGTGGDISADIHKFCADFSPLLEENHKFLVHVLDFSLAILSIIIFTSMLECAVLY